MPNKFASIPQLFVISIRNDACFCLTAINNINMNILQFLDHKSQ